jgi:hypothetical protein
MVRDARRQSRKCAAELVPLRSPRAEERAVRGLLERLAHIGEDSAVLDVEEPGGAREGSPSLERGSLPTPPPGFPGRIHPCGFTRRDPRWVKSP